MAPDWDGNISRLSVEFEKLAEARVKSPDVQELIKESIKRRIEIGGKKWLKQ